MQDGEMFANAMNFFENGNFKRCHALLKILADKYKHTRIGAVNAAVMVQLYCAYQVSCATMGIENQYLHKLAAHDDDNNNNLLTLPPDLFIHAQKIHCMALLERTEYTKVRPLMPYLQIFTGPNISPITMSYFQETDRNKTLLVYNSGGIGDIIMYSRFIRQLCESQLEKGTGNTVMYLVNDELHWMMHQALSGLRNLQVVQFTAFKRSPQKYDHHTNVNMLFVHLNIAYEMLRNDCYLEHVQGSAITTADFIHPHKKNVVINWCGNKANMMERFNRSIPLAALTPLFQRHAHAIQFMSVQKTASPEEAAMLDAHNVKNYGPLLDNAGDAFKDTVTLLKAVDLVITTDTSLVHLAATMNVPCWCMLTIGCDWRWKPADHLWYPNVKPFRQNAVASWDNVVAEVSAALDAIGAAADAAAAAAAAAI
jgi:hypothetical protein